MPTTTQEDYFGDAVDPPHRRKHRHRRHRSHPSDSELEDLSPRETVQEEREHRKPRRRRESSETVDPIETVRSDTDTDRVSTDDGKRRKGKHRHRTRERIPDDASNAISDPESSTDVESSTKSSSVRKRAKSVGESALAVLGLEDRHKRARSRSRGRRQPLGSDEGYDSPRERSRSKSGINSDSAQAAIIAAAVEAFRARKEPGGITSSRGLKKIVEAAVASGVVEKFLDRKGENDSKSNRRIAEAVLAGLAAQRGISGKTRKAAGKEPSNPLKELAASGLIAAAGKKLLDYQRSRSQSRRRGKSESPERPERPDLGRKRSHSVGEALAALGLGGLAAERYAKALHGRKDSRNPRIRHDDSSSESSSDSDLELDEDDEKKRLQKLRRKEIMGIAFAILATLQLGRTGYMAREKRAERREKLESGEVTEEEANMIKRKAMLGDAATVGLAVLAVAEAIKAWQRMNKGRRQYHEFLKKHERIEEHRRRKSTDQAANSGGAVPGGEASRYYNQPGYMGPPPGARDVPTYPYYPSSGRISIPNDGTYAYSTRDGKQIPVVYPSSISHG